MCRNRFFASLLNLLNLSNPKPCKISSYQSTSWCLFAQQYFADSAAAAAAHLLTQGMVKTRSFLSQLSAPPDFVPAHLEELTTAALQQKQKQQQQQQAAESVQAEASSSSSSSGTPQS